MPIKKKKSAFQPFSIAFLDCICCGFGAIILLFVVTSGKKAEHRVNQLSDTEVDLGRLRMDIKAEEKALLELANTIKQVKANISELKKKEIEVSDTKETRTMDLKLLLEQLVSLEEQQAKLLDEKENLPTTPEPAPIPVPNPVKRQYLTDFKFFGERVLFLVEASGSMLDETIEKAAERLDDTDEEKQEAPKWKRTITTVEWLLTGLKPPTRYQIYYFNKETHSIFPTRLTEWLEISDRQTMAETLEAIHKIVPEGGANLEQAFFYIGSLNPKPDNVILFTDGLPTLSNSEGAGGVVDDTARIRMFNAAQRHVPLGTPINVIMSYMSGDPAAPSLFWLLSTKTKGSFICPAKEWPEI